MPPGKRTPAASPQGAHSAKRHAAAPAPPQPEAIKAIAHTRTKPHHIPGIENVEVRGSRVHGRGLFATRPIAKGERIIQYLGEKVPKKEGSRRTEAQWARGRVYTFELNKRFDIDGDFEWNVARLANHSCNPNCESENERGRAVWVVAKRAIGQGEELSYDYNFPLVDPPPVCKCGAVNCRGYIVGSEHLKDLNAWLRRQGLPTVRKGKGKAA